MRKMLVVFGSILAITLSWNVQAQTVDCDDVVWDQEILDRMPSANEYCLGVVRIGNNFFAELHAEVLRQTGRDTVVRYRRQDGSWGRSEHVHPPRGFTANISGEEVEISDLPRRQEVDILVRDEGHFAVPSFTVAQVPESRPVQRAEPMPMASEPRPTQLPSTAGQVHWFLILGSLMLALAVGLRLTRA